MRNKPLKGLIQKKSPLKHPHPEHPHKKSKKSGPHPATRPGYFKDKDVKVNL